MLDSYPDINMFVLTNIQYGIVKYFTQTTEREYLETTVNNGSFAKRVKRSIHEIIVFLMRYESPIGYCSEICAAIMQ